MKGFDKAQREYDNQLPPEYDCPECPMCGDELARYKVGPDDGWICRECGWNISDPEDGYDGILGEG